MTLRLSGGQSDSDLESIRNSCDVFFSVKWYSLLTQNSYFAPKDLFCVYHF